MTIEIIVLLFSVGFIAGYIDAIAGGGGMITVPTLLSVGLPPHIALGTNKLASSLGIMHAVRLFIKHGYVKPKLWSAMILASFIGSAIGTITVYFVSATILDDILPIAIVLLALYMMLTTFRKKKIIILQQTKPSKTASVGLGGCLGFYDGFFGPGTGTFWTALLLKVYKLDLVEATAVTKVMNFTSNLASLLVFMVFAMVNYSYGLVMAVGHIAGAYLGAHSAIKYGANFIRPIFLTVVISLAIYLIVT